MSAFVARARWVLARHPSLYWTVVAVGIVIAAATVRHAVREADASRDRWGATRTVWVVSAATERGDPIAAEPRNLPIAMVPDAAIATAPSTPAARRLGVGEIIVDDDVAGTGSIPAGWVVMSVEQRSAPTLAAGDGVAVFADGIRLCGGVVAANDGDRIEVAVDDACAAQVSAADMVVLGRIP